MNSATRRQIEAEDQLNREEPHGGDTMSHSEMAYLEAMEDVKTISKKLVEAEQAFVLVRDRIQELVSRYQSLLIQMEEDESFPENASVATYNSSYVSDQNSEYWDEREKAERDRWARRAKRAEIRAEVAAREALMAKQEARMIQEEKTRELEHLQQRLLELQSDPSTVLSQRHQSGAIAQNLYTRNQQQHQGNEQSVRSASMNREKLDDVKQRFRDRVAAKKREQYQTSTPMAAARPAPKVSPSPPSAREFFQSAGEEMYQHLDFYERSLRAVESSHQPL